MARRFAAYCARVLLFLVVLSPIGALAQDAPHPAMWKIKTGTSTVYVFGSLHILPDGFRWRAPELDAAIAQTDVFMFEVPVDAQATERQKAFIVQNGLLPRGASLRAVLSRVEFQTYTRILAGAGLKPEQFVRYRPWLAAVIVGLAYIHRRDITTLRGVDDDIIDYAQSQGRELHYLETIEQQMQLLIMGDDRNQVEALKRQLVALPRALSHTADLLDTWAKGDADRFAALIGQDFSGHVEAQDLLISNRNRAWMPSIVELLNSGKTAMVTVGAAHIGGPKGLIALLCAAGYDVERVGANGSPDTRSCGPGA